MPDQTVSWITYKYKQKSYCTTLEKSHYGNINKNNVSNTMVINYVPVSAVTAPLEDVKGILPIGAAS